MQPRVEARLASASSTHASIETPSGMSVDAPPKNAPKPVSTRIEPAVEWLPDQFRPSANRRLVTGSQSSVAGCEPTLGRDT